MMNLSSESNNNSETIDNREAVKEENERILCPHCKRTATNGIKCKGICVADSDY